MLQSTKIYAFSYFNIIIYGHIMYQYKGTDKASLDLKKNETTCLEYALSLQKKKNCALAGGRKVDLIIPSYLEWF